MSMYTISKSSLLSLKAEILRKQQELTKAKSENEVKIKTLKKSPLEIKNKGVEARDSNDQSDVDQDLLKQSRSILEQKAALYEKLSSGEVSEGDKERNKVFLVRFDKKNTENINKTGDVPPSDSESDKRPDSEDDNDYYQSDDEEDIEPGEKWVDYVDCFGRTRRCMQKDLESLKSKDEEMKKVVKEKNQSLHSQQSESDDKSVPSSTVSASDNETDQSELLSSDMRRELLRQQWENEEEALRNKTDIHYEDILFGEARTHGVGYYRFSKDDTERAKQQEALKQLRKETENKQKKAQELKITRDQLLAARLKAARNRKRARMGLPPEEDNEPEAPPPPEIPECDLEKKKNDEDRERDLEEARKKHVRPWDIGKEGVKEHQVLTQEEWVEKKRDERPSEFAPPTHYRKNFRAEDIDLTGQESIEGSHLKCSTKKISNIKSRYKMNENCDKISSETIRNKVKASGCSSTQNDDALLCDYQKINQTPTKRNFVSTPIENEVDSDVDELLRDYKKSTSKPKKEDANKTIEIPPPASCNYYDPSHSKRKTNSVDLSVDDDHFQDYEKVVATSKSYSELGIKDTLLDDYTQAKKEHLNKRMGIEIPPPPTFDYYGPSHSKMKKVSAGFHNTAIQDSIEQGLEFLRKQVEHKKKSSRNREDMFLC